MKTGRGAAVAILLTGLLAGLTAASGCAGRSPAAGMDLRAERIAVLIERAEQMALVERALQTLSSEKREAFLLKHVEGLSYEEMAEATGERIPTLKMRVHRARAALLDALKESS